VPDQLVMGNGFALQSAQVTSGTEADILAFYAQTMPTAGTPVNFRSWEAQAAVSRLQDELSIVAESNIVGDDGLRSAIIRDLEPLPRTSEDCDNAALAFLADHVGTYYNGTYTCTSLFFVPPASGDPGAEQYWPTVGRFFTVNAPARNIYDERMLVTQLTVSVLDAVTEVIQFQVTFGADLHLEKVLKNFVDLQPAQVLAPSDKANPPDPRYTQDVDSSYLPDLTNTSVPAGGIKSDLVTVTVQDAVTGYIEVRKIDSNWGLGKKGSSWTDDNWRSGATSDLVMVIPKPTSAPITFTLQRLQYDQVWYMRPVLNGITSRRSYVLHVHYPKKPAPPLVISAAGSVVQFDFAGDMRNIYGFELRAMNVGSESSLDEILNLGATGWVAVADFNASEDWTAVPPSAGASATIGFSGGMGPASLGLSGAMVVGLDNPGDTVALHFDTPKDLTINGVASDSDNFFIAARLDYTPGSPSPNTEPYPLQKILVALTDINGQQAFWELTSDYFDASTWKPGGWQYFQCPRQLQQYTSALNNGGGMYTGTAAAAGQLVSVSGMYGPSMPVTAFTAPNATFNFSFSIPSPFQTIQLQPWMLVSPFKSLVYSLNGSVVQGVNAMTLTFGTNEDNGRGGIEFEYYMQTNPQGVPTDGFWAFMLEDLGAGASSVMCSTGGAGSLIPGTYSIGESEAARGETSATMLGVKAVVSPVEGITIPFDWGHVTDVAITFQHWNDWPVTALVGPMLFIQEGAGGASVVSSESDFTGPQTVIVQKPVASYADLSIDLTQTSLGVMNDISAVGLYAYFFNVQWEYSDPVEVDLVGLEYDVEVSSNYSQKLSDAKLLCYSDDGPFDVMLLPQANWTGRLIVKKMSSDSNTITILPATGELIDGRASLQLVNQYDYFVLDTQQNVALFR
jgi:hypothetical protein